MTTKDGTTTGNMTAIFQQALAPGEAPIHVHLRRTTAAMEASTTRRMAMLDGMARSVGGRGLSWDWLSPVQHEAKRHHQQAKQDAHEAEAKRKLHRRTKFQMTNYTDEQTTKAVQELREILGVEGSGKTLSVDRVFWLQIERKKEKFRGRFLANVPGTGVTQTMVDISQQVRIIVGLRKRRNSEDIVIPDIEELGNEAAITGAWAIACEAVTGDEYACELNTVVG